MVILPFRAVTATFTIKPSRREIGRDTHHFVGSQAISSQLPWDRQLLHTAQAIEPPWLQAGWLAG